MYKRLLYKRHEYILLFAFCTTFIFSLIFKIEIDNITLDRIINFFAIVFGFYTTAVAILFSSKLTRIYITKEDESLAGKSMLHTIRDYFKASCYILLISIVLILVFPLIVNPANNVFLSATIISLSIIDIICMFLICRILFVCLIEEAKN